MYGAAPHPDYLLGRDSIYQYHARGLTATQWEGWKLYYKHCGSPMRRADINSALERNQMSEKPVRDVERIIPQYGKKRKLLGWEESRDRARASAAIIEENGKAVRRHEVASIAAPGVEQPLTFQNSQPSSPPMSPDSPQACTPQETTPKDSGTDSTGL